MASESRSTARFGRAVAAAVIAVVGLATATTAIVANTRDRSPSTTAPNGGGDRAATDPGSGRTGGTTTPDPAAPATAGTTPARTMAELEARWADARARVVAALTAPGFGLGADNVLRGPSGFTADLNRCPAGWSPDEGVTDTTITLGHITAQSGALASYSRYTAGLQAYLDEVNAAGGVGGRAISLAVADDAGVEANTVKAVAGLQGGQRPFAITTIGSTSTLAVRDQLNASCTPQPLVLSLDPSWADPATHPWTTGAQIPYNVEAGLWGAWIEKNLAAGGPVRVAALVSDDAIGRLYQQAFQTWADAHPTVVSAFEPVRHAPNAQSVAAPMATVAQSAPDVFIAMTVSRPCLLAVQAANDTGLARSARALFTPSRCADPSLIMTPGGAQGPWHTVTDGIRSPTEARFAGDPYLAWVSASLSRHGLDPADRLAAVGFGYLGWAEVEALRIAAALPGGLTRPNLLLALHGLALQHPMTYDGVAFATSGPADPYPLEGAEVRAWDAATGAWISDGPALDANTATPPCAWADNHC